MNLGSLAREAINGAIFGWPFLYALLNLSHESGLSTSLRLLSCGQITVLPVAPVNDSPDSRIGHTEHCAELGLVVFTGGIEAKDPVHFGPCQFSRPLCLTLRPACPAFRNRVLGVLAIGSGEEVFRINAWRVVAAMADVQSFPYFAILQFVCNPVRRTTLSKVADQSVPFPVSGASPHPTTSWFQTGSLPEVPNELILE